MDDDSILIIDDATRERLKRFIAETEKQLHAEKMLLRKSGSAARYQGEPISAWPVDVAGYLKIHWLEGLCWEGRTEPRGGCGRRLQHDAGRARRGLHRLGIFNRLSVDLASGLVAGVRSGYRPDVLPTVQ